ncbi:MAG: hypothetical protein IPH98_06810 [Saprospiraceae bacterium]|nr:hypothetical protein [Candidatus Defluviibacterium haderslevense]
MLRLVNETGGIFGSVRSYKMTVVPFNSSPDCLSKVSASNWILALFRYIFLRISVNSPGRPLRNVIDSVVYPA